MITVLRKLVESRQGRLYSDLEPMAITSPSHGEAWRTALDACDPFQTRHTDRAEVAVFFGVPEEETKLTLVSINQCPLFVQLPVKRVGQDGKVRLSLEEFRVLGGMPDHGCIRLA